MIRLIYNSFWSICVFYPVSRHQDICEKYSAPIAISITIIWSYKKQNSSKSASLLSKSFRKENHPIFSLQFRVYAIHGCVFAGILISGFWIDSDCLKCDQCRGDGSSSGSSSSVFANWISFEIHLVWYFRLASATVFCLTQVSDRIVFVIFALGS